MKKLYFILSVILCSTLLFNSISVFALDDDSVLTLEEAKELALKNDVQFNLQQRNIQKASESYEKVYENNTGTDKTNYKSVADRAAAEVSRKLAIENAASNVRKAIFNRNDLKRASDYSVTDAYLGVIKAKYSVINAEAEVELKRNELETARIKYNLGIITRNSLTQAETTYESSKTSYNNAFSDLQSSMSKLGNNIGKNLDVFNIQLDMTQSLPEIESLDLNKIKKDYMKNNSTFYSLKEQYDLTEYNLQLTEEKYDYYYKRMPNRTSTVMDQLNDMLNDAQKDFEAAKYSYKLKEDDLDLTLSNQYISINNAYESYENLINNLEDEKSALELNRLKYEMRLITKTELAKSEANIKKMENQIYVSALNLIIQYLNITQYSLD